MLVPRLIHGNKGKQPLSYIGYHGYYDIIVLSQIPKVTTTLLAPPD